MRRVSVLCVVGFIIMSGQPARSDDSTDKFYPDPAVVTVERDGKIVDRLDCERIPLDFPDLAGRGEAHLALDSQGDIWATVGYTVQYGVDGKGPTRLFHSQDGGRTWTSRIIEQTREGNPVIAFTVLQDDSMVMSLNHEREYMEVYVSRDRGKNWQLTTKISRDPFRCIGEGTMSMTQLSDGRLLYPLARFTHPGEDLILDKRLLLHSMYVSTDGGKTFPVAHSTFRDCCEAQVLELQSGKLLGAFRYQRGRYTNETFEEITALGGAGQGGQFRGVKIGGLVFKNVFLGDSDDGVTWKNFRPLRDNKGRLLLNFGECYGRLIQVPDGRVVLVYDNRFPLEEGDIRARVSRDDGKTWEPQRYYLSLGRGYPSSVVLKDGTIVTVTGNTSFKTEGGMDLPWTAQVIRWKLP